MTNANLSINNNEYRRAINALADFASKLTEQEWLETRNSQVLLCEDEGSWSQPENLLSRMAGTMIGEIELRFQWRLRYTKGLNVGIIGALRDEKAAVVMIMDDVEKVWRESDETTFDAENELSLGKFGTTTGADFALDF